MLKKTMNILTLTCAMVCAGCGNEITIDTHVDIAGPHYATKELDPGVDNPNLRCDLTKMENGGMDGVFLAVFIGQRPQFDPEAYKKVHKDALERFGAIHRLPEMYPERCELVSSPFSVRKVVQSGKRAIMIGLENGYPIGDNLAHITSPSSVHP